MIRNPWIRKNPLSPGTNSMQSLAANAHRIVVKVGSSLVTNDGRGLDQAAIGEWARQIADLKGQGKEVVLVSSGAITGVHSIRAGQRSLITFSGCGEISCKAVPA